MSVRSKKPDRCRDCRSFWTKGIPDGKHDQWCCHFGAPASTKQGHCIQMNAKTPQVPA